MKKLIVLGLALVCVFSLVACSNSKDGNETVSFHDKTINKSELSEETLKWLEHYNTLSSEEQLAISSIPADLYKLCGYGNTSEIVADESGQKAVSGSEVYSFPEPTTMITGSFYSQGQETAFEIGSEEYDPNDLSTTSVIKWFYDLKLTACDKPETVEGSESYAFYVKGENAFTYEDRGSEAYIIVGGNYYKVSNPSTPPID